jgi:hypothetical protein
MAGGRRGPPRAGWPVLYGASNRGSLFSFERVSKDVVPHPEIVAPPSDDA